MPARAIACVLVLTLGTPSAFAGGPRKPPSGQEPVFVVLRTRDDVYVGRDLRYEKATFQLQEESGPTRVPEGQVTRVAFLRATPDGRRGEGRPLRPRVKDPVVGMALRLAFHRVLKGRTRLPTDVLFLPGEKPAKSFLRIARKLTKPELVAVLCAECAGLYLRQGTPQAAQVLFAQAEKQAKASKNEELAFAYALMRAAILADPRRPLDWGRALRQLHMVYPTEGARLDKFRDALQQFRDRGPRPHRPLGKGLER